MKGSSQLTGGSANFTESFLQNPIINGPSPPRARVKQIQIKQHPENIVWFLRQKEEESVFDYSWERSKQPEHNPVSQPLLIQLAIFPTQSLDDRIRTLKVM